MKLGERLKTIAIRVAGGGPMADIGTDHAYLPIYLIEQGDIPRAIAVEVCEGPFQAAKEMIQRAGLADKIELRFGNGLEPLRPGEVSTIAIAGMGGSTIIDILERSPDIIAGVKRLVLQPMTGAGALRRWLAEHGWRLEDEELAYEEGRLYEIIVAEQGEAGGFDDVLYEIGPVLWLKKPPLLLTHIEQLLTHTGRIVAEMGQSPKAVQSSKYRELTRRIQALEERRVCLLNAMQ